MKKYLVLLFTTLMVPSLSFADGSDAAKINFGKPDEQSLGEISVAEMQKHIDDGQFAAGSMLPKTQAALSFLSGKSGRTAIITSLEKTAEAISGSAGTCVQS